MHILKMLALETTIRAPGHADYPHACVSHKMAVEHKQNVLAAQIAHIMHFEFCENILKDLFNYQPAEV